MGNFLSKTPPPSPPDCSRCKIARREQEIYLYCEIKTGQIVNEKWRKFYYQQDENGKYLKSKREWRCKYCGKDVSLSYKDFNGKILNLRVAVARERRGEEIERRKQLGGNLGVVMMEGKKGREVDDGY